MADADVASRRYVGLHVRLVRVRAVDRAETIVDGKTVVEQGHGAPAQGGLAGLDLRRLLLHVHMKDDLPAGRLVVQGDEVVHGNGADGVSGHAERLERLIDS